MSVQAGEIVREARTRRRWSQAALAVRAGTSPAHVAQVEGGKPASLETYARLLTALELQPAVTATDPRDRRSRARNDQDLVHSAMGEIEAARLHASGFEVRLDEPYQHYQFAGRADVVAWEVSARALLHIENRTQFPNVQEALGSYGAKRAYLPAVLAERLGLENRGWARVTHVIVALWSAEVLHVLRRRRETFRAACPDAATDFRAWWHGKPGTGAVAGRATSALILLDPGRVREQFRLASLDEAMTVRPRYRDYADAARALTEQDEPRRRKTPERARSLGGPNP